MSHVLSRLSESHTAVLTIEVTQTCTLEHSRLPIVTESHTAIHAARIARTQHTHTHTLTYTVPQSPSLHPAPHVPYSHFPSHALLPLPRPTHPSGHTQGPPPGGHALRPGTFAASRLAHTSHILSHPHSLCSSDSFSIQPTPSPTSSQPGDARPAAPPRPSQGARWTAPCRLGPGAPTACPITDSQTDRQTDTHAHSHPRAAPPHGSSLFLIMGQCACLLTQLEMVRE